LFLLLIIPHRCADYYFEYRDVRQDNALIFFGIDQDITKHSWLGGADGIHEAVLHDTKKHRSKLGTVLVVAALFTVDTLDCLESGESIVPCLLPRLECYRTIAWNDACSVTKDLHLTGLQ